MKNENYYIGLDIGTDSVGYAVTDESYELCKFKGEAMWGVTLFDEAMLAVERRGFRTARRRLDRRQQRVQLIQELFAKEISKVDTNFYKRIQESYLYPENVENKVRLFDTYQNQKEYVKKYPTIHHLISELMTDSTPHDARLVYVACAWLVAHRGHFLSDVDKRNIDAVTDFKAVYDELIAFIEHDEFVLPWSKDVDVEAIKNVLKSKIGVNKKVKALTAVLFGNGKAPKEVNGQYEYNYELIIKLICGSDGVKLKDLFDKEAYADLTVNSVSLKNDDETLEAIMQSLGDDGELIAVLKKIYDWAVLVDVLKGRNTISEAKVTVYEQHARDLAFLKKLIRKYSSKRYNEIFRLDTVKNNYVSYIGKNKTENKDIKVAKSKSKEDFCKYILSVVKSITPNASEQSDYDDMIARLESGDFLPKQVDGDNRVIPYQLYWYELNKILENAKAYIPFLSECDVDGITGAEKILSVFEFRVPYYVGPLKENPDKIKSVNHWMVRKAEGKIYPWNFNDKVNLDESEDEFIKRMTNHCTYLPGEDVLPKNSLVYSAFEVLNEINNIKINGNDIPVSVKQDIFNRVFMEREKVTQKSIVEHLQKYHKMEKTDVLSGIDVNANSSLRPFIKFKNLVGNGLLTYSDVEEIIKHATYSEDKARFTKWLRDNYQNLPENEIKYVSGLKFKEFGRLSRKLLCGIEGAVNHETGEYMTIIRTMWETNDNIMQLLTDKFDFKKNIDHLAKEYYDLNPKSISERLDEMHVSNAVKRPIIRTLDILKDIVKVKGKAPERIFIEMARGSNEDLKGKRSVTRLKQITDYYDTIKDKDIRELKDTLASWGDTAHNKLQSDKVFLYFIQLGKCLYTGKPIDLDSVLAGDGNYNVDHIRPRCFVKDDSVINNLVLVDSKENARKGDGPMPQDIVDKMRSHWDYLKKVGLLSDEKYKRLTRTTEFTEEEKFEFINRQLVETRQSTKVVASLLGELYPNTEIIYVKAGLVSDFRHEFDLPKSRAVNDLHHAKDAYLNVVAGNVWHSKFSKSFWHLNTTHNAKPEITFNNPVRCNGKTVWNGAEDKQRVIEIARKNTAHMTMYSYYKHSGNKCGFFKQNPLKAAEGLIPLKKDMPTEIYGGYDSATVAGFALVKYRSGKNNEISLVPVKLLDMEKFVADDNYALQYVSNELGDKATDIEFLLNKRILKIFTMLSLDGARYCIRGKASPKEIGLMNMMPFKTSPENEFYIKKLESLYEKHKKNENFIWDEKYNTVSIEKNIELYNLYVEKLSSWPYTTRPGNATLVNKLIAHSADFEKLDIFKQTNVLLQIQGLLGRMKQADLKVFNESPTSGTMPLSLNISNWKKNYTDVRIIDQSASGLFESASDNILELL